MGPLQPLSPFCAPLPAFHRPSSSPEHNIQPGTSSRHNVVARISIGIDEHKRNRYCVSDALTHVCIITAQCQNCPAYSALMKVVFGLAPQGGWGIPRGKEGKFFPFQPFNWLIISQSHFSRCEQFSLLTKTRPKSYTLTCSYSYFYGIPKIKSQMLKFRLVFLPRYQRDTKGHMFCLGIRNQPEEQTAI